MNCSAGKISTISKGSARANDLSTPPIGCGLHLPGLPGGGNKIYDRSPYGNVGTITGATWTRLPSGLWCLDFDGTDDYVDCGAMAELHSIAAFTVLFWAKQDVLDVLDYLWEKAVDVNTRMLGYTAADGSLMTVVCNGSNAYSLFDYSTVITATKWFQYAAVFDGGGAANADRLKVFLDATQVTLTFGGAAIPATTADMTGADFTIGKSASSFDGCIALFRIYNRALSALEIQNHFNREKHLFGVW